jgi:hypothetical protein
MTPIFDGLHVQQVYNDIRFYRLRSFLLSSHVSIKLQGTRILQFLQPGLKMAVEQMAWIGYGMITANPARGNPWSS